MAWTTPRTWAAAELVTAALMNTHVRDNLNALKAPPGDDVELTGDLTTTSASFVDVTGATVTFTSAGGNLFAMFHCILAGSTASTIKLRFVLDGAGTNALAAQYAPAAAQWQNSTIIYRWTAGITAGSHTIKVQWLTDAGTATMGNATASAFLYTGELAT